MNTLRQFFKELDMFPASAGLRIREGTEVTNGFVGFISLLLVLLFAFVFFSSLIQVVNHENIQYSMADESLPSTGTEFETDTIVYALRIEDINHSTAVKIFTFKILGINDTFSTEFTMHQCTPSDFEILGQSAQQHYTENSLENYFCPPKGLVFKNAQEQSNHVSYHMTVDFCQVGETPQCLPIDEADQLLFDQIPFSNFFIEARLVLIDIGFTPGRTAPTVKIFNPDVSFTFTFDRSILMNIDYSRYRVETDESFMPWAETKIQEGAYIMEISDDNFDNDGRFYLAQIRFDMKLHQKTIKRILGKFDYLLSYAGGLFAIIIGFLSFFLISFNEYRYELLVGQRAFSYDEKGNKVRESDFNFLFYVQYSLFDWLNVLFCLDLQWGRCKRVDQTREELNKQIDTTLLMRRLQHIERCVFSTVGEDYKMGMYMHRSEHLEEIKLNRMYLEYYEWIIKGGESLTVGDIETAEHIFSSPNQLNENSLLDFAMKSSSRGLLSTVMDKFPELQEEALSIQLTEEQLEVEKNLASAFRSMNSKVKEKLEKKIPLKILYRFKVYDKESNYPLNYANHSIIPSGYKSVLRDISDDGS